MEKPARKGCQKCQVEQDLSDFPKHWSAKDGRMKVCLKCKGIAKSAKNKAIVEKIIGKKKPVVPWSSKELKEMSPETKEQLIKENLSEQTEVIKAIKA